eukprot:2971637-Alexandrium_andersonii.AAC.1
MCIRDRSTEQGLPQQDQLEAHQWLRVTPALLLAVPSGQADAEQNDGEPEPGCPAAANHAQ